MTTIGSRTTFDPIGLEVLRNRLEAIIEEAASTIQRTAISPVVTEGLDYSATLLDADGQLICGGGFVKYHWWAASHSVKSTIAHYGDCIEPGDVFLANDPHTGGGLHLGDVMVQRPIFVNDVRVAWAALSSHLMDVGGMVPGSFASTATECFQEGLRIPPVRLFRAGVEVTDVWDIIRTNIRLAVQGEMDLRSLVAGCHVAQERVAALASAEGTDDFRAGIEALLQSSTTQMQRRIEQVEDGFYNVVSWAEWGSEFFTIPCELTVTGDRMVFDFTGAAPQVPHFFNSKLYIIESGLGQSIAWMIAPDLPYCQGIFNQLELRCPDGTVVSSVAPAPINAAHIHVAKVAYEAGVECVRLALAASPGVPASHFLTGWQSGTAMGVSSWTFADRDGNPDIFLLQEGAKSGSAAGVGRDGIDLAWSLIGADFPTGFMDIEMWEAWFPILVNEKRSRPGENGPGMFRSGSGCQMRIEPYGTDEFTGTMLGIRQWLPLHGAAGGWPGAKNAFIVHHQDGSSEEVGAQQSGVRVGSGEQFEVRSASGGGFGDPLDRDVDHLRDDLALGRLTPAEASRAYGIRFDAEGDIDNAATEVHRAALMALRLQRAVMPSPPAVGPEPSADEPSFPLYPGIIQRGSLAITESGGTVLAVAPDHWTDGCAVLEEPQAGDGPPVVIRSYLDPSTGRSLFVEAVPLGAPRSFEARPLRWIRHSPDWERDPKPAETIGTSPGRR